MKNNSLKKIELDQGFIKNKIKIKLKKKNKKYLEIKENA